MYCSRASLELRAGRAGGIRWMPSVQFFFEEKQEQIAPASLALSFRGFFLRHF
jgi:hypothetical protein